jgi:hypothetical protein
MRFDINKRTKEEEKRLAREFDDMARLAQKLAVEKWGKADLKRVGIYQATMAMVSVLHILLDCKYHYPESWDWLMQSFADKRPLHIYAPHVIVSTLARSAFGHVDRKFPFIKAWPWTREEMYAEGQVQLECLKKPLVDGIAEFVDRIMGSVSGEINPKQDHTPANLGNDRLFDGFDKRKSEGGLN